MTKVIKLDVWRTVREDEDRAPTRGGRAAPEVVTYVVNVEWAKAELDHADMVALSGMFRRWAIYEIEVTPSRRTRLIEWSADFERIAESVGTEWRATEPSEEPSAIKFMASQERQTSSVVDLVALGEFLKNVRP